VPVPAITAAGYLVAVAVAVAVITAAGYLVAVAMPATTVASSLVQP